MDAKSKLILSKLIEYTCISKSPAMILNNAIAGDNIFPTLQISFEQLSEIIKYFNILTNIPLSEKGIPNGVATLDNLGKLNLSQMPLTQKTVFFNANYNNNYYSYKVNSILPLGMDRFSFIIPNDFISLVSLNLVGIPIANFNDNIQFESSYANVNQFCNINFQPPIPILFNAIQDDITEFNISSLYPLLSAGNYCGLEVLHIGATTPTIHYIGIKLIYNIV